MALRRPGPLPGLCLVVSISVPFPTRASECEKRAPVRFVLERTRADRNGAKDGEIVVGETAPRHIVLLRLEEDDGAPVCWREVTFESNATEQIDFIDGKATTNEEGLVANVLLRKVPASRVNTRFTVHEEQGLAATFGLRGIFSFIDGSAQSFGAPPLGDFFGPTQSMSGVIGNFFSPATVGSEIRAWSLQPRIAEPGPLDVTDRFRSFPGVQEVTWSVTARALGQTLFAIDTWEANTYTADIRGDIHPLFIRGDCNLDDLVDLADAVFALDALFRSGAPFRLFEACNSNDDGSVDIADAVYLLSHLFRGGPAPPPPFPGKDRDPDPP